ncbi:MAG: M20/M25/M40 family metallo-hydrolase [Nanoarchaeota archaeon]|nr:M20/M25/M40 family metallo-hydrolase [Nanoarchaeota archaeon]
MTDVVNVLKDLISIDSNCNISNKDLVNYIKDKLSMFEVTEFLLKKGDLDLYNLIIKVRGLSNESPLVFVGHTDTVPGDLGWPSSFLQAREDNGRIYGLGASDMKGGIASLISAVLSLKERPKNDLYIILSADEEGSGKGARDIIKKFSLKNARVVVMEPTTRKIVYAQKGCLDLKVSIGGKSIHSSYANAEYNESNNAINKALRVCNALTDYSRVIEQKQDSLMEHPHLTISMIKGGTAQNSTAGNCDITLSRRMTMDETIKETYEEIKDIIDKECTEAEVSVIFEGEPFHTDKNSSFIKDIAKISRDFLGPTEFNFKKSWTEAAIFSKWGETVIFGPGDESECHKSNESIAIDDLIKFTQIYKKLIEDEDYSLKNA